MKAKVLESYMYQYCIAIDVSPVQIQYDRARPRHIHSHHSILSNLNDLVPGDVVEHHRSPFIQLVIVRVPIKCDPRDRITSVCQESLHANTLNTCALVRTRRQLEGERLARSWPTRAGCGIVSPHLYDGNTLQSAIDIRCVRVLVGTAQLDVAYAHIVGHQVTEKRCDHDIPIVRGFCAEGLIDGLDGLP